jgi:hypothetical protein
MPQLGAEVRFVVPPPALADREPLSQVLPPSRHPKPKSGRVEKPDPPPESPVA